MGRYQKLLKNTFLITLGTFGSKLLPFVLIRLYTFVLQDGEYNTADLVSQTAKLLIPFAALGLTEGLFRLAMEGDEARRKKVFSAGFVLFAGGFAVLLPLLGLAYVGLSAAGSDFARYIWLIGSYVCCSCLHSLVTQYIRTKDHFAFFSLQGVINTALVAALNIVFLYFNDFGVTGYVLSVVLADLIVFFLVFIKEKLWRDLVPVKKIEKTIYKEMVSYSVPLIPMSVSWWVTSVSDRYMVRAFVDDPSIADFYSAAYKIPTLVTLLCTVFSQAWSYSSVAESDEKERSAFFSGVFSFYSGLLFVMSAFITAFCKILTSIMMDPSYYSAWEYIPVLAGATVFSALVTFVGSVYTVRMKSSFSMWTSMIGAGLNILLNFLLIPQSLFGIPLPGLGALGAAIATMISYAAVFFIRAATAGRYVRFKMNKGLLAVNIVLMLMQITFTTLSGTMSLGVQIGVQTAFIAAVLILNGRALAGKVKELLNKRRGR
ncbi:MAG: oligosaccharide flippase family protein [Clostridia bacterium]|nr:oligosaccharide flippase family protein [Clostridia bacterium]